MVSIPQCNYSAPLTPFLFYSSVDMKVYSFKKGDIVMTLLLYLSCGYSKVDLSILEVAIYIDSIKLSGILLVILLFDLMCW